MKHLILATLLSFSFLSNAQWTEQTSGVSTQLTDVRFKTDNLGFAIGAGKILKTANGGLSWFTSYNCDYFLESIEFTQTKIHVVGYNLTTSESMYISSTNNGATWTETTLPSTGILNDLFFPSDLTGYAIGSQGDLLKTTNGGTNWTLHGTGISSMIQALYFHDNNHGFAVGGFSGGYLFETTDGGLTWTELPILATTFLQGITFSSPTIGYIAGWDGDIFKTSDGGSTWTPQTPAAVYGNLDVCFTDDNTGYIVGGSATSAEIQKTINGGNSWFSQSPGVNQGLIAVHFPSPGTGYAVGSGGTILSTTNAGGLTLTEIENNAHQVEIFPNPCTDKFELKTAFNVEQIVSIQIISDQGKLVYNQSYDQDEPMNVSELAAGVYLVKINLEEHTIIKKLYKK